MLLLGHRARRRCSTTSSVARRSCAGSTRRRPGIDRIATPTVRERGIVVSNARGVFSRPIAEYVVMMSLAIARRLPQLLELQRERTWQPLRGRELGALTVGDRRVRQHRRRGGPPARAVRDCRDHGHPSPPRARGRRRVERRAPRARSARRAARARADIVVVAAPLTEETAGLIGAEQLGQMREDAWLINIARGRLHRRAGAAPGARGGLDRRRGARRVQRGAAARADSPLYGTPNLVITPHTSWASDRVVERTVDLFVDNLRRDAAGEPLRNVVDLDAGY